MAKQQLNSLDRFRKDPGRLVLEQHSHCEVPAGCGGVVLRWRNPRAAVPFRLYVYTQGAQALCWLDGQPLQGGGVDLPPGPHAVALHLPRADLAAGLLMFAAIFEPHSGRDRPGQVQEQPFAVRSAHDGTWKVALTYPGSDAWQLPDYDDSTWETLVQVPTPPLEWGDPGGPESRWCHERGALCLGLATPQATTGPVWVRKAFTVAVAAQP